MDNSSLNSPSDSASLNDTTSKSTLAEARIELVVPAAIQFLPVLCAALREYCAALPTLVQSPDSPLLPKLTEIQFDIYQTDSLMGSYRHLVYSLELALQEAAANIVRHGYEGYNEDNPNKNIKLQLGLEFLENNGGLRPTLVIELSDYGIPFDPTAVDYQLPEPSMLSESGYGMYLIHRLTDQLLYSYSDGQNHLRMLKFLD